MFSGALNHLAKARSLSFVLFCVRLLILVGSALTFKVKVKQVSKLITLTHDVRLGCLAMELPFGFLFKMGEIQSHCTLGNERDPRQAVKRAVTFLSLKKGLWITRVPLWIVYKVGNSVLCPDRKSVV